ncbi:agrin-like [Anneissia japonica]|uniref:agrin-like n=1 Tax=Anneissia japonica TaxID=1529436 RepID=UPI001425A82F|nr:agrin-like [Anneissia japonica]
MAYVSWLIALYLFIAAIGVHTANGQGACGFCPQPRYYERVCGSDGKTYPSKCLLFKLACELGKEDLYVQFAGRCELANWEDETPTTPEPTTEQKITTVKKVQALFMSGIFRCLSLNIICPRRLTIGEVCGTDQMTYENECMMRRTACRTGVVIEKSRDGPCVMAIQPAKTKPKKAPVTESPYSCARLKKNRAMLHDVCGVNGMTYQNECKLRRTACKYGSPITKAYSGKCVKHQAQQAQPKTCPKRCPRPDKNDKVCGSDLRSYPSECVLKKKACEKKETVGVLSRGKCPRKSQLKRTTTTTQKPTTLPIVTTTIPTTITLTTVEPTEAAFSVSGNAGEMMMPRDESSPEEDSFDAVGEASIPAKEQDVFGTVVQATLPPLPVKEQEIFGIVGEATLPPLPAQVQDSLDSVGEASLVAQEQNSFDAVGEASIPEQPFDPTTPEPLPPTEPNISEVEFDILTNPPDPPRRKVKVTISSSSGSNEVVANTGVGPAVSSAYDSSSFYMIYRPRSRTGQLRRRQQQQQQQQQQKQPVVHGGQSGSNMRYRYQTYRRRQRVMGQYKAQKIGGSSGGHSGVGRRR